ncbi:MAG: hypothetical protein HKO65_14020 [Gemmatimonadetes bacterium]|nr:alkylmercury lyase family protein [Gemmatimonadota bacterium]NNM06202.1 hypothetical protein [Gemmatimonadota bacterium]
MNQTETDRAVLREVLRSFPRSGVPPTLDELRERLHLDSEKILAALGHLQASGFLRFDTKSARITEAYPYSSFPTRHKVTLADGREVYCMCAIDTFYVPFLNDSDVRIRSNCLHCETEVQLRVEGEEVSSVEPPDTVIWHSGAEYDCPNTNFFCNLDHLRAWRVRFPGERGQVCTVEDALARGRKAVEQTRTLIG